MQHTMTAMPVTLPPADLQPVFQQRERPFPATKSLTGPLISEKASSRHISSFPGARATALQSILCDRPGCSCWHPTAAEGMCAYLSMVQPQRPTPNTPTDNTHGPLTNCPPNSSFQQLPDLTTSLTPSQQGVPLIVPHAPLSKHRGHDAPPSMVVLCKRSNPVHS